MTRRRRDPGRPIDVAMWVALGLLVATTVGMSVYFALRVPW